MKIKSIIYREVKRAGLLQPYLKLNFLIKKWLKIKQPDYQRLTGFYASFIKPNDVVFDIGANLGTRSEVFLGLGGKVICLEPNRELFEILNFRFDKRMPVTIMNAGCGESIGMKEFHVASNHLVSTFSDKFIDHKLTQGDKHKWKDSSVTEIVTLDWLVDKFGVPDFCKIDVEGYERQVLMGLNRKIGLISFEFTSPTFNEDSIWCIKKLETLDYHEYNMSFKESLQFEFENWISSEEILRYIEKSDKMNVASYGDIYAR